MGIEILVLLAILVPFVLGLFWLVRPVGRLPIVKDITLESPSPKVSKGVHILVHLLAGLTFGYLAVQAAFPEMSEKSVAPNYPEALIIGFGSMYFLLAAFRFGNQSVSTKTNGFIFFVYAMLAMAESFPAWFGLKHEPKYVLSVLISIFLSLSVLGMWKQQRVQRILQDADSVDHDGQTSSHELSAQVRRLAGAGEKLEAVKRYKEETGVSLMEAKQVVEAYIASQES